MCYHQNFYSRSIVWIAFYQLKSDGKSFFLFNFHLAKSVAGQGSMYQPKVKL